eukprot:4853915-Ditylum_brightwellii.AAC.1
MFTLEVDDTQELKWYMDVVFGLHADMKSHTSTSFTLSNGGVISESIEQKVGSRSSTKTELVAVDDKISKAIWTNKFLEYQGFNVKLNIIYQDNESSIKLENNGKERSDKHMCHFRIIFYVTDLVDRDEVTVQY